MEIIRQLAKIDTTNKMTVAYDVSKDKLNYYSEVEGKISGRNYRDFYAVQGLCKNRESYNPNKFQKCESQYGLVA